jgi:hypothetical protein
MRKIREVLRLRFELRLGQRAIDTRSPVIPSVVIRKTLVESAREYPERNRQKSHRTYLGYRNAVEFFVAHCKKVYFDQIRRDDILDYLYLLKTYASPKTSKPLGVSTIFNYFLKTMIFLNDRGIGK